MTVTRSGRGAPAIGTVRARCYFEARCNAVGGEMVAGQTIGIAGAGSIGCFVGGMLAAGGRRVSLLGRPRVIAETEAGGPRPTSFGGFDQPHPPHQFALSANP